MPERLRFAHAGAYGDLLSLAECTVIAERRSLVAAAPGRMSVFLSERGRVVCRPALLLDYRGPHLCPTDAENVDQEVHV